MNIIAAPLYGVSVAVLFAIGLALAHGALDGFIALLSLAAGSVVTIFAFWRDRHTSSGWERPRFWGWASLVLFALFALRAFLWLIFRDGDAIKVLSPNNVGDMSLHLTYIQYLASGATFWPDNPIHALSKLTYPIGVDLLNSLLVLRGCDIIRGLIWVGLAGSALAAAALWRWGGSFVLFGFLCNGGLLGFDLFRRWELHDYQSEAAWPDGFPAIGWKSIPLALFVTQRGFLFALPAGLLLLESWRNRFFEEGTKPHLPLWGELLLYASLPIFHLHTFLFLSLLLGCWLLVHRAARGEIAWLLALAFIPASTLVFLVTGRFQGASMIGFHPGWMQNEQNFFAFWGLNFGLLPLIVFALAVMLMWRWKKPWPAAIVFPALGIFLLCCVVRFAPWEWDNTKLMIWCYLAILPAIWTHLLMRTPALIRWVTCFLLFFSGFVSLLGGLDRRHQGYSIAARSDLDFLHNSLRRLPINQRFIGHPTYNHPLLLHGRPMAMGYSGHVWSHGLSYAGLVKDVETILRGEPEWKRAAEKLGVRYLYWGREERENYPDSTEPWKDEAWLVAAGEWGEIYDLSAPGTGAGAARDSSGSR